MTMRQFVKEHRVEIDSQFGTINDRDRELVVMNYEPLYLQARECGVKSCK